MRHQPAIAHFVLSGLILSIAACGYEGDDPLPAIYENLAQTSRAVVRLATSRQLRDFEVVPNSYIVAFRSEQPQQAFASYLTEYKVHYAPLLERVQADPRVVDINYIHHMNLADPDLLGIDEDLAPLPALQLALSQSPSSAVPASIAEVQFRSPGDAVLVLSEWEQNGVIWFAEPNGLAYLSGVFADFKTTYEQGDIWWHRNINLYAAFEAIDTRDDSAAGIGEPVVAVLDSGLDVQHQAFNNPNRLWQNPNPGQSGCTGDVNGCDTTKAHKGILGDGDVTPYGVQAGTRLCDTSSEDTKKNCPHGTHVAGIIAANWQAQYGGVCPVCRILPVKIFTRGPGGTGSASDAAILNGFKYISRFVSSASGQLSVRVVNSSFGKYERSRAVSLLVSVLAKAQVLVVGAASNENSMLRAYPSALEPAIAVAALDPENKKASYSNYGPWVDVSAPGGQGVAGGGGEVNILSSTPGDNSEVKSGTSMASPVVAGVAGLVLAADPGRDRQSLKDSIVRGANPIIYSADTASGFNRAYYYPKISGENTRRPLLGAGVVDARCAVAGNCNTGLDPNGRRRVNNGCGVIAAAKSDGPGWWWILALLGVPILLRSRCYRPR